MSRRPTVENLILALFVLGVSGCAALGNKGPVADHVVKARQLSQQGLEAQHRGRWQLAADKLRAAVNTCPDDSGARQHYADLLRQNGDIEGAIEQMELAIAVCEGPPPPDALVQLGQMRLENDQSGDARVLADQAIRADPTHAFAWSLKGIVQYNSGQPERALATLQRAIALGDDQIETQLAVAEVYRQLGRPRRSLTTVQAALERIPPEQQPQRLLHLKGMALAALNRHDDAAQALQLAQAKGDPPATLMLDLARAQFATGQLAEASWSAQRAIELTSAGDVRPIQGLQSQIELARARSSGKFR